MKRTTWIVAVVCAILLADLFLFGQYLPPLVWHVRHGNFVAMHGVRFSVPLLYEEDEDRRVNRLLIITRQTRFRRKIGAITIEFRKRAPFPQDTPQVREFEERVEGVRRAVTRKLLLAGREGECVEYVPINRDQGNGVMLSLDWYTIDCRFGDDMGASFSGTQNAAQDFYAVLQSAGAVKGKD